MTNAQDGANMNTQKSQYVQYLQHVLAWQCELTCGSMGVQFHFSIGVPRCLFLLVLWVSRPLCKGIHAGRHLLIILLKGPFPSKRTFIHSCGHASQPQHTLTLTHTHTPSKHNNKQFDTLSPPKVCLDTHW